MLPFVASLVTTLVIGWLMLIGGSGLLAGFAGVFFFYLGLSLPGGDISKLRPIAFALAPATAVILGWLILHEEMTWRKAIAVVLIVVGIMMLAGGKASQHGKTAKAAESVPTSGEAAAAPVAAPTVASSRA